MLLLSLILCQGVIEGVGGILLITKPTLMLPVRQGDPLYALRSGRRLGFFLFLIAGGSFRAVFLSSGNYNLAFKLYHSLFLADTIYEWWQRPSERLALKVGLIYHGIFASAFNILC